MIAYDELGIAIKVLTGILLVYQNSSSLILLVLNTRKKNLLRSLEIVVCVLPGMVPRTEVFTSLLSLRHL